MRPPQDIRSIIEATGLPCAYREWKASPDNPAPPPPYCVYYAGRANNFAADGVVWFTAQSYTVELYTEDKEPATEAALEAALTATGIFWTKDEAYIDSERMNEIIYEFEV